MKKNILFSALLLVFGAAHADLQSLNNQQLQQVEGQASAATIDWTLRLNQKETTAGSGVYTFDTDTCADLRFCRFAVSSNNRYDNGSYIDATGTIRKPDGSAGTAADLGKKQWLVFKGIQGSIQLQKVDIDGTDLLYSSDANMTGTPDQIKAALQVSFKAANPIKIRNFGFNALSIETDTVANEGTGNVPGYLNADKYGATAGTNIKVTTSVYDQGRETGFMGMMMNGNLALQGNLKVFSCDGSMKRC
ncbi:MULTISPECIES: hypothetical protein [Acinetobacter]|uniref:Uncharacterized protein n=1 Tax=Acinetobacter parvus DSM 16617 = CIP 108168 TaxID=981333 RepID=N8RN41_9GAMM|nr:MULTISPECIES: hypothetical protein [Acinetobacter]ENU35507.1 hypothetical protein F988_02153 [Acinetobacter parvus DSM 16617 = CIP 108168]ENU88671.1 hypothetical protein F972_02025 [Acinetobacter sp. CIP 102529]MCU4392868.1 hypothetical protein [Acinetobacter parvus]MCU4613696.1 hypothetical protein [Acinetobacter parvus]